MAKVRDFMTGEVVTIDPNVSLRDALEALMGEGVSGAPVAESGEVMGVVSVTDILEFEVTHPGVPTATPEQTEWGEFEAPETWEEAEESPSAFFVDFWSDAGAEVTARFEETESPEWDLLEDHVVGEVMSRKVVKVTPDSSLQDAARIMLDSESQRILVLSNGEIQGILTATDIVRAVAEGAV